MVGPGVELANNMEIGQAVLLGKVDALVCALSVCLPGLFMTSQAYLQVFGLKLKFGATLKNGHVT